MKERNFGKIRTRATYISINHKLYSYNTFLTLVAICDSTLENPTYASITNILCFREGQNLRDAGILP